MFKKNFLYNKVQSKRLSFLATKRNISFRYKHEIINAQISMKIMKCELKESTARLSHRYSNIFIYNARIYHYTNFKSY